MTEQEVIAYVNHRLKSLQHAISCDTTSTGKPRVTSTLTIFTEGDYTKVATKDRELELTLFRSGSSIIEALFRASDALCNGDKDWRKCGRRRS